MGRLHVWVALLASAALPAGVLGQLPTASARLVDAQGREVGSVRLQETPIKGVLLVLDISGLPAGSYGMHIHETGRCEPPTFESAGDHFNPFGHDHGARSPNGMHAGDLLNLEVPAEGRIEVERLARSVTLVPGLVNSLLDEDGSALVIHERPDDHVTQPSGNSGDPIVCGVIRP